MWKTRQKKSFKTNSTTAPSNPTTPSIAKVTGLNVTEIKDKSAKISWNRVSGATQYQVYYRLENLIFYLMQIQ